MAPMEAAREVRSVLEAGGHEAWLAGGCVRDHLLGIEPKDFDVATSARPEEVEQLFRRTIAVGKSFGVIGVLLGGRQIEVATFRSESDYSDGRHPDRVTFADARTDVERRDFTVNGLLWDPDRDEILDYVGGRADVEQRVIRAIGVPDERFEEDGLRLMRAVRFGSYLDFHVDDETLEAVRRHRQRLAAVAPERIREELKRIATHPMSRRGDAWRLLATTGLGEIILDVAPTTEEAHDDARVLDALGTRDLSLFLAVPLRRRAGAGAPPRELRQVGEAAAQRLRCSARERELLGALLACRLRYRALPGASLTRRRLAAACPDAEAHEDLLAAEGDAEEALEVLAATRREHGGRLPDPLLGGVDLAVAGVPRGPLMGWLLRKARVLQLEGRLGDREAALAWVRG